MIRMDTLGWNQVRGQHVVAALELESPYSFQCVLKAEERSKCKYPGIDFELFDYIAELLGLSYTLMRPKDHEWGSMENGTWNGIMGMLIRGEANITMSTVIKTPERVNAVDFTHSILTERRGFAFLTPTNQNLHFLLSKPFSMKVWIGIFESILLSTSVLSMAEMLSQPLPSRASTLLRFLKIMNREFWRVFRESIGQATTVTTEGSWRCILWTTWRWSIFVILSSYSGSLIGYLMLRQELHPISTTQELIPLIQSGQYRFLTETTEEIDALKAVGFSPAFRRHPPLVVESQTEAIRHLVRDPALVYMGSALYLLSNLRSYCNLTVVLDSTSKHVISQHFLLPKGSTLTSHVDRQLYLLADFAKRLVRRYAGRSSCNEELVEQESLSIPQTGGTLLILAIGFGVALLLIVLELSLFLVAKYHRRHRKIRKERRNDIELNE